MLIHNNAETQDSSCPDQLIQELPSPETNKAKWQESKASKEPEEVSVIEAASVEEVASEIEAEEEASEEATEVASEAETEVDVRILLSYLYFKLVRGASRGGFRGSR